jgi:hypothetical protein
MSRVLSVTAYPETPLAPAASLSPVFASFHGSTLIHVNHRPQQNVMTCGGSGVTNMTRL